MYACRYGDEPIDLKWMGLYICRRWAILLIATLLTAGIFAGSYCLFTFALVKEPNYTAKSVLCVNYNENVKLDNVYINDYTWQQLAKTDVVMDYVQEHMSQELSREYLENAVFAGLESDVRIVNLRVTTADASLSVELADVYEQALIAFGEQMEDIESVTILTHATHADAPQVDNRVVKMTITGAVIGAIFSFLGVCLAFAMDDSVYVPTAFERRFGIQVLGTFNDRGKEVYKGELALQLAEHLREHEQVVLTGVQEDNEGAVILKLIEEERITLPKNLTFEVVDSVCEQPENIMKLIGYDGVVLAIPAGCHNARMIERTIHFIKSQGGHIGGVIIYNAPAKMLKAYYAFRKVKSVSDKENDKADNDKTGE